MLLWTNPARTTQHDDLRVVDIRYAGQCVKHRTTELINVAILMRDAWIIRISIGARRKERDVFYGNGLRPLEQRDVIIEPLMTKLAPRRSPNDRLALLTRIRVPDGPVGARHNASLGRRAARYPELNHS